MKKQFLLLIVLLFSGLTVATAQSLSQMKVPPRKMPKMSDRNILNVDDFETLFNKTANRMVIDLRSEEAYKTSHLDGAVNLNSADTVNFNAAIAKINNKTTVFIYGANKKDAKKETPLIQTIMNTNNPNVYYLDGGFEAWNKKKKPVVLSEAPDTGTGF